MTQKATLYIAPFGTLAVPSPDPFFGQRRYLLATLPAAYSPGLIRALNWTADRHENLDVVLLIETLEAGVQFAEITGLHVDRFLTPWGHRSWEQLVLDDLRENPAEVAAWLDSVPAEERATLHEQIPAGTRLELISTHPEFGFLPNTYSDLLDALSGGMPTEFLERIDVDSSSAPAHTADLA
ncbi:hypothetical protein ACRAWC_01645 [Leifsonia sp. L25]